MSNIEIESLTFRKTVMNVESQKIEVRSRWRALNRSWMKTCVIRGEAFNGWLLQNWAERCRLEEKEKKGQGSCKLVPVT